MKQYFLSAAKLLSLTMVLFTSSCKKASVNNGTGENNLPEAASAIAPPGAVLPNFQKLADTLAFRLKNNCVGYSLIVSYKGQYQTSRSGGQCRRVQDAPAQPFTMFTKYSIASVSKTITATALIKKMSELPGGTSNLDAPIWTYLPSHWQLGKNIKTITFRQLLTHTSGFRYDPNPFSTQNGDDYQTLKNLVFAGINLVDKTPSYNNRNFAILRLIIPKMAQYSIITIAPNTLPAIIQVMELAQAQECADGYKDYCRQTIFNKLGTTATQTIDCVNTDANPGLCYLFPLTNGAGYFSGGDASLSSGAQGWVLNTFQINDFFTSLQYTQNLLPYSLSALMRDQLLGYDKNGVTNDGISFYWKNGVYDFGNPVGASYRSLIIGFGDDVQITIMSNSGINLQNAAILAHQDWHS
jgi:hypothetical protein